LESASAIKKELKDNVNVTVVGTGSVAFESTLGNKIGGVNYLFIYLFIYIFKAL